MVRVELHHATAPGKVTELARMHIANDGTGTSSLRNYMVRILRGRGAAQLDRNVQQRDCRIENFPSESVHVWNLVARALKAMEYG